MIHEPLVVAIHLGGNNGVGVDGLIRIDNKVSGDEPYCFNVVILYLLFFECDIQLDYFLTYYFRDFCLLVMIFFSSLS